MKNTIFYIILLSLPFLLTNCEREITADLPEHVEKIVVDGAIESGSQPIVILNKNYPYFGTFTFEEYQQNFIHNATIQVKNGERTVALQEICWSYLTDFEKQLLSATIGGIPDSVSANFDFCLYTVGESDFDFVGEYGEKYELEIALEDGQLLTASTTIPQPIELDSMWLEQHKNENFADYWRLYASFTDPDTIGNYYRYYTSTNDAAFRPGLGSVFDDLFINGATFNFPLDEALSRGTEFELDTYGYFESGEKVSLKWATIDRNTYKYWHTLEYAANSTGPFGRGTQIQTNIEGGIGVWAGYANAEIKTRVAGE